MGKKAELLIKEDLLSLKKSLFEAKTMTAKRRIQSLVFIKEEKFETRQHLADYLCIHIRTLEKWLVRYKSMGLSQLISIARRGKRSQEMNPHIHQSLKEKLGSPTNYFCSYKEALLWTNETFHTNFKYSWFRNYLIKHFATKLKVPRKSHIKKDKKDIAIFLKSSLQFLEE